MSSNIILNSENREYIRSAFDNQEIAPEVQADFMGVGRHFIDLTKANLRELKEIVMQKATLAYERYQIELNGLKKTKVLSENINPNSLIVDYLEDQQNIECAIDNALRPDESIFLKKLQERESRLLRSLRASKVVFCIAKYFPHIAHKVVQKNEGLYFSHTMLSSIIERYKALNELIQKQDKALLNITANPALAKELTQKVHQECRVLILEGYIDVGFEIFFSLEDKEKIEFLYLMLVSCKKHRLDAAFFLGKMIKFAQHIENEHNRSKFLTELTYFYKLPLKERAKIFAIAQALESQENQMHEEFLNPDQELLAWKKHQNPIERLSENRGCFIEALSMLNLNLAEKKEILALTNNVREKQVVDICARLCADQSLEEEIVEAIIEKALQMSFINRYEVFKNLSRLDLSEEVKEKIFHHISPWGGIIVNKSSMQMRREAFFQLRWSLIERKEIFEKIEKMDPNDQAEIIEELCQFHVSAEERRWIFNIIQLMNDEIAKKSSLKAFCHLDLSLEEKSKIFESVQKMRESFYTQILAPLFESEEMLDKMRNSEVNMQLLYFQKLDQFKWSSEQKNELLNIAQGINEESDRAFVLGLFCKLELSLEERIEIFKSACLMKDEKEKVFLFECLGMCPLSPDEIQAIASVALELKNSARRVKIFSALVMHK